jgi:amidohydrolase
MTPLTFLLLGLLNAQAAPAAPSADLDARVTAVEQDMLAWRRHLHQHPELSNREVETAKFVAGKLRGLGPRCGTTSTRG